MRLLFISVLLLVVSRASFSQSASQAKVAAIDSQLTQAFIALQEADSEARSKKLTTAFTRLLKKYLSNPVTLEHDLDTLSTLITIVPSANNKLKLYSWTENTKDDYFLIHGFIQFKTGAHTVSYVPLKPRKEYPYSDFGDGQVFELAEIREGKKVYYLTFAWGSYGSGKQHQVVQVYALKDNKLVVYQAFPEKKEKLVLQYTRRDRLSLSFDEKKNAITFDVFEWDSDTGFPYKTGAQKTLVFKNGAFR